MLSKLVHLNKLKNSRVLATGHTETKLAQNIIWNIEKVQLAVIFHKVSILHVDLELSAKPKTAPNKSWCLGQESQKEISLVQFSGGKKREVEGHSIVYILTISFWIIRQYNIDINPFDDFFLNIHKPYSYNVIQCLFKDSSCKEL